MLKAVDMLRDKYPGETCWIVGKGPSLRYLRDEDIGAGPVITINQSIVIVQEFGIPNPIYALQKDGCGATCEQARCMKCGFRHAMIVPHEDVTVILQHPDYSEFCLWEHPLRVWVDPIADLGFDHPSTMSIRMAIAIARVMGCARVVFVCCDSLTSESFETYDIQTGEISSDRSGHYSFVAPQVLEDVMSFPHEFIIPKERIHA